MSAMGDLKLTISADRKPLTDALGKASGDAKKWANESNKAVKEVTKGFGTLKTAIAGALTIGAVVKGFHMMSDAIDRLDKIGKTAQMVGMTSERLQELGYAAERSGSSKESMAKALTKLNVGLGEAREGTGELRAVMDKYGVSLTNTNGSMKTSAQIFDEFADIVANTDDVVAKSTITGAMFGKRMGSELNTMMSQGTEGINKLAEAANRLGLVMTNEMTANAEKAKDAMDDLKAMILMELTAAIGNNAEAIEDWAERGKLAFRSVVDNADEYLKYLKWIGVALAGLYSAKVLAGAVRFVSLLAKTVPLLVKAAKAATILAVVNPLTAAAAIAGMTAAYYGLNKILGDTNDSMEELKANNDAIVPPTYDEDFAAMQRLNDMRRRNLETQYSQRKESEDYKLAVDALTKAEEEQLRVLKIKHGVISDAAAAAAATTSPASESPTTKAPINGTPITDTAAADLARLREEIQRRYQSRELTLLADHEKELAQIRIAFADDELQMHYHTAEAERKLDNELTALELENMEKTLAAAQAAVDNRMRLDAMVDPESAFIRQAKAELELYATLTQSETDLATLRKQFNDEHTRQFGTATENLMMDWDNMVGNMQQATADWLDGSVEALSNFATTGKLDFKSFADSIIKDLVRIMLQESMVRMFASAFGAGPAIPAAAPSSGSKIQDALRPPPRASGGSVYPGTVYQVGEKGMELFAPSAPGRILNNHTAKNMGGGAQAVKVEVVNRGTPQKATGSNVRMDAKGMVVQVILEDMARGGPIASGMGAMYGMRRSV